VRRNGAILAAWIDAPESVGAEARVMLAVCDAKTGVLRAKYRVGMAMDNHCGPAMVMDGRGRVHLVIGGHHTPFKYRWSDNPEDPGSWSEPELLGPADTYPSLIVDAKGTLHLAHREMFLGRENRQKPWEL